MRRLAWSTATAAGAAAGTAGLYLGLVTAAVPLDLGIGRCYRELGPLTVDIAAPRDVVFDILAAPYLTRQTHAMADKIRVLERGADMVLAAHRTPIGRGLVATTVETVRFTRPERIDFRLVRGPVPEVTEQFLFTGDQRTTRLDYHGRLGTDLWTVGAWWGGLVAQRWQQTVADTFAAVRVEAERRPDRH
ncbi:MAG TPA: SRPBCC family protein [Pseudonocardiaceae bacterium]|nr:SRPBCC family protein [Pseudonocardiaceae bacterium]